MKYTIGVDYGTQSGRAVLVEVSTGCVRAQAVREYTHGVMDEYLPDGKTPLGPDWALQHPMDYLEVLYETIPAALRDSGVSPQDVIGMSIDFTSCTVLPVDQNGVPLCFNQELAKNPHAWVKLWKHHAAQYEANKLNRIAEERCEAFLGRYGGKISSEWVFPKLMQILDEAPEIYEKMDRFMEATDWVTMMLCGKERRNSCTAGYKALWHKKDGYPSKEFFKALDPRLENVVEEKLAATLYPLSTRAGGLTEQMAQKTGLLPGTAVAVGNVDAHVSVPAVGITEPGKMLMIIGTSTCDILLGSEERIVPGMCGVAEDGVLPGLYGYEAGQSCVGDHFEWLVEQCVPPYAFEEAKAAGVSIHSYLTEKASRLKVGESGLLALDWWNGNKTPYVDGRLSGVLVGCTLNTKSEEIYRALIEATAFGTRKIVEMYKEANPDIRMIIASGGIAEKNPLFMQIYADVLNCEIRLSATDQTAALGSAIYAAVAAGKANGGYDSVEEAVKNMSHLKEKKYTPIPENVKMYNELFDIYCELIRIFDPNKTSVMSRILHMKQKNEE